MTKKELRKLSRRDLLEMLIEQGQEVQSLRERLSKAEAALQKRELVINNAGSLAEASLLLGGVFEAAENAAQQYLENIRLLSDRQESVCDELERDSREKAGLLLMQAERRCTEMESETRIRCAEMTAKAKAESQAYWDEVSEKLETYYTKHTGLRELLALLMPKQYKGQDV